MYAVKIVSMYYVYGELMDFEAGDDFLSVGEGGSYMRNLNPLRSDLLTVTSVLNPSSMSNDRLFSYKARRHVLTTGTTTVSTSRLTSSVSFHDFHIQKKQPKLLDPCAGTTSCLHVCASLLSPEEREKPT